MKASTWKCGALAVMLISLLVGFTPIIAKSAGDKIDICNQVSAEQLTKLYRKHLYPSAHTNDCFWSEKPGAMAYMDINVHDVNRPLREYFAKTIPSHIKLVKITDLGDEGLMSVSEGSLGVVVIRKGDRVLQSAVTFLEIKPGSTQQAALWDIYRSVLKKM